MTGEDSRIRSPRALFAQRFAELYAAAGNPTLRRVATAAENRMRSAHGARPGGASAQRISDWKAGRNVPARFESLLPVVLTLTDLARKTGHPLPRRLAEPKEWQRLWQEATTWNPDEESEAACPYPGLTAYDGRNRDLFFGRARATTELTDLVRSAGGVIVVIGASGAGKSSLLAAGLVPALTGWEATLFTPGADPLAALRNAVAETVGRTALEAEPEALAPRADGPRRLLVVDQAEELFTTCVDDRVREEFLALLEACASRSDDPVAVVLALRADFYAHCLNHLVLQDALEHRSYLLGPMRTDELAQAISGPGRAVGLELESGLEELVITELCGAGDQHGRRTYDPGALPLLSHVMAAAWQHREGRRLTTTGYRKAGGVVGSVAETAEYAWNELSPAQQTAARELLLGLVTVARDARDTRRSALRTDLLARAANPEDATAALELLSRTRLITLDADAVTLTHEIVLTAWPRLRTWIDEDRVGYLVRQRLETDAAEWAAQDRDSSLLYRSTLLNNALGHAEPPPVGPLAREFLATAVAAQRKSRTRSVRTRALFALLGAALLLVAFGAYSQTRLADQRADDKNFAAVLAEADRVRTIDPSLAAQLDLVAWRMRPDDQTVRSRLLRTQDVPLETVAPTHSTAIEKIVYRPDGRILASVANGSLRLWDSTDPQHPKPLADKPLPVLNAPDPEQPDTAAVELSDVGGASFSSDGTLLATISNVDGGPRSIAVWDVSAPTTPRRISTVPDISDSNYAQVAFVPGGRTLAVLRSTKFSLWNVGDPANPSLAASRVVPIGTGDRLELGVSPNGRLLTIAHTALTPSTPQLDLWDITNVTNPVAVVSPGEPIHADRLSAFSPDGTTLAVLAKDGLALPGRTTDTTLELWDITDPNRARRYSTVNVGTAAVGGVEFAPDGKVLAMSRTEGTTLWNVADPSRPSRLGVELPSDPGICHYSDLTMPCKGSPTTLAFAPGGHTVATGDATGNIRAWSIPPTILAVPAGPAGTALFDRTGARMVTFSDNGQIVVWDLRNPEQPGRIGEARTEPGYIGAALSPDGRTLLTRSSPDGLYAGETQRVFDLSDPAHIRPLGDLTFPGALFTPPVSPDLRLGAATNADQSIQLWNLSDLLHPKPVGTRLPIATLYPGAAFYADGQTLLVGELVGDSKNAQFVVTLWNTADPEHPQRVSELLHQPAVGRDQAVITPDRRTMVVTTNETFRSWDISDPTRPLRIGEPVAGHTLTIMSVQFTSDSRTMITTSVDGAVQLWDFTNPAHPTRKYSLAESGDTYSIAHFDPDDRHVALIAAGGPIHLWDMDIQHAIARVCDVTGRLWTKDLWHRHLPQLPYQPPC